MWFPRALPAALGIGVLIFALTPAAQRKLSAYLQRRWPGCVVDPTQVLIGFLLGAALLAVGMFIIVLFVR